MTHMVLQNVNVYRANVIQYNTLLLAHALLVLMQPICEDWIAIPGLSKSQTVLNYAMHLTNLWLLISLHNNCSTQRFLVLLMPYVVKCLAFPPHHTVPRIAAILSKPENPRAASAPGTVQPPGDQRADGAGAKGNKWCRLPANGGTGSGGEEPESAGSDWDDDSNVANGDSAGSFLGIKDGLWHLYKLAFLRALEASFYAGVVPLVFIDDEHLYFDKSQCVLLILYVFINVHFVLLVRTYAVRFPDLCRESYRRGAWRLVHRPYKNELTLQQLDRAASWSNKKTYKQGAVVCYSGCMYIAECPRNTTRPGNTTSRVLYDLLDRPGRAYLLLAVVHGLMVTAQLFMLLKHPSLRWWVTHSVMLLCSCFMFFLCTHARKEHKAWLERQ